MCGIAGFTIAPGIGLERTALARLLLAGIAERGTDATGYGYHAADGSVEVHKESLAPARVRRARRSSRGRRRGDLPRARLHEGRAVGQRQQPSGALRPQCHRPQRPSRQRRRPLPALRRRALHAAHHGRLRGHRHAGRPQRRHRRGARRGARQRSRRRALGRRARTADARAARIAAALPRPRRRLRPVRFDAPSRSSSQARATGRKIRIEEIAEGRALELREGRVESRRRFHVDRRYVGQALVTYPPLAEKPALLRLALAAF